MSRIALGGLGADSHTIGLFVLRVALQNEGFDVVYLGIQNDFNRFEAAATFCDAVMISNMDGHAAHYLAGIGKLPSPALWYLGGNPSLDGNYDAFQSFGFKRIYTGFVSANQVIDALREDGLTVRNVPPCSLPPRPMQSVELRLREDVLSQWATGSEARDLEANAAILADRPSLARLQAETDHALLHPRSGVADANAQGRLFDELLDAGAEVLSLQADSLTRDSRYEAVAQVLRTNGGLNGFPAVNHGPNVIRQITGNSPVPVQLRHSAREPRLLAEISYAGGISAFEGGAICYNLPYYADLSLQTSLDRWHYVDCLTGSYADRGIILDREFFGTLTAVLVPPWLAIAVDLIEAMLAVAQGVRSVSLAYAEQGCREQDIAAMRVLRRLGERYAGRGGTVQIATVFHQYMGAFPLDHDSAEWLIEASATTAVAARATRIVLKTPTEARRIPDAAANARGLELAARGAKALVTPDEAWIEAEEARIEAAALAVVEAVLATRPSDLSGAVLAAFAEGILDIPFSPSAQNAGQLWAARDADGAVRVLTPGRVPLPDEVLRYDREALAPRLRERGLAPSNGWQLVAEDVLAAARPGASWPLGRRGLQAPCPTVTERQT